MTVVIGVPVRHGLARCVGSAALLRLAAYVRLGRRFHITTRRRPRLAAAPACAAPPLARAVRPRLSVVCCAATRLEVGVGRLAEAVGAIQGALPTLVCRPLPAPPPRVAPAASWAHSLLRQRRATCVESERTITALLESAEGPCVVIRRGALQLAWHGVFVRYGMRSSRGSL